MKDFEKVSVENVDLRSRVREDTDFLQNEVEVIKKDYDGLKAEAVKYKNEAEKMIENLHAENSQQTEYIVKHSI